MQEGQDDSTSELSFSDFMEASQHRMPVDSRMKTSNDPAKHIEPWTEFPHKDIKNAMVAMIAISQFYDLKVELH